MAANIQKFVPVDGAYRISSDEQGDLVEFLKSQMRATGNRTPTGELSKKGVLTKVVIDGVDRFFKNKGKGSWQFDDLKTKKKNDQIRVDNTIGFTPLEEIQMDFLDEVQAVKDEYNKNANDTNGAKTADKKLKAIFKKYRKVNAGLDKNGKPIFFRAGQYDPSKWDSYGWKFGANREDYGQWKKDVYNKYQVEGSKGHIKPANQGGTNARTSLIDESASSNYSTQDKKGTFRSDEELASATIAYSGSTALQEYILEKDPTTRTNVRFLEQDRTRMGTELDTPIEQIESEAEDNLLNSQIQAHQEQIEASYRRSLPSNNQLHNLFSIGANTHDLWKKGAIAVGKSPIANELTGGLTGKIVDINNAIEDTLSGNPKKTIPTFLSLSTQALTTTEDTPYRALKASENY